MSEATIFVSAATWSRPERAISIHRRVNDRRAAARILAAAENYCRRDEAVVSTVSEVISDDLAGIVDAEGKEG